MLNKRFAHRFLLAFSMMILAVSASYAAQIAGDFSLSSTAGQAMVPVISSTGATATMATATGLDFTTIIVGGFPRRRLVSLDSSRSTPRPAISPHLPERPALSKISLLPA